MFILLVFTHKVLLVLLEQRMLLDIYRGSRQLCQMGQGYFRAPTTSPAALTLVVIIGFFLIMCVCVFFFVAASFL